MQTFDFVSIGAYTKDTIVTRSGRWMVLAVLAFGLTILQVAWLLPVLDSRVDLILQGTMPPPAHYHRLYIGADLAKLALLLWIGIGALRRLAGARLRRQEAG